MQPTLSPIVPTDSIDDVEQEDDLIFFGDWEITQIAAVSTGLPDDEGRLIFQEDFVGYTVHYSRDSYRLGDNSIQAPVYTFREMSTCSDFFFGIRIKDAQAFMDLLDEHGIDSEAEWPIYYIELTDEQAIDEELSPASRFYVLDKDHLLLGMWGVILFAERVME